MCDTVEVLSLTSFLGDFINLYFDGLLYSSFCGFTLCSLFLFLFLVLAGWLVFDWCRYV